MKIFTVKAGTNIGGRDTGGQSQGSFDRIKGNENRMPANAFSRCQS